MLCSLPMTLAPIKPFVYTLRHYEKYGFPSSSVPSKVDVKSMFENLSSISLLTQTSSVSPKPPQKWQQNLTIFSPLLWRKHLIPSKLVWQEGNQQCNESMKKIKEVEINNENFMSNVAQDFSNENFKRAFKSSTTELFNKNRVKIEESMGTSWLQSAKFDQSQLSDSHRQKIEVSNHPKCSPLRWYWHDSLKRRTGKILHNSQLLWWHIPPWCKSQSMTERHQGRKWSHLYMLWPMEQNGRTNPVQSMHGCEHARTTQNILFQY